MLGALALHPRRGHLQKFGVQQLHLSIGSGFVALSKIRYKPRKDLDLMRSFVHAGKDFHLNNHKKVEQTLQNSCPSSRLFE